MLIAVDFVLCRIEVKAKHTLINLIIMVLYLIINFSFAKLYRPHYKILKWESGSDYTLAGIMFVYAIANSLFVVFLDWIKRLIMLKTGLDKVKEQNTEKH